MGQHFAQSDALSHGAQIVDPIDGAFSCSAMSSPNPRRNHKLSVQDRQGFTDSAQSSTAFRSAARALALLTSQSRLLEVRARELPLHLTPAAVVYNPFLDQLFHGRLGGVRGTSLALIDSCSPGLLHERRKAASGAAKTPRVAWPGFSRRRMGQPPQQGVDDEEGAPPYVDCLPTQTYCRRSIPLRRSLATRKRSLEP
jgi:hypothetical protein